MATPGKRVVTPKCQNSSKSATCSSMKQSLKKLATVSCSTQKVTTARVKENLFQTTLIPSTTARDTNEDQ
eukprot:10750825-Ditylum_brightwellii.AAC.1